MIPYREHLLSISEQMLTASDKDAVYIVHSQPNALTEILVHFIGSRLTGLLNAIFQNEN